MKTLKIILSLIFICQIFIAQSQSDSSLNDYDRKPLLNDSIEFSGYASPVFLITQTANQLSPYIGGMGGLIIADKLIIGGYGFGNIKKTPIEEGKYKDSYLSSSHGGLYLGYSIKYNATVHPNIFFLVGYGTLSITGSEVFPKAENSDNFTIIMPYIEGEININEFLRIGVGISYSFVQNVSTEPFTDNDFTKPAFLVGIKLGKY